MSATKPFIVEDGEFVDLEKEPGETPEDAYAEYISRRREVSQEPKIAVLKIPTPQLEALGILLNTALDKRDEKDPLTQVEIEFWNVAIREINRALQEAQ